MEKFISIPVKRGDCFFLQVRHQEKDFNILVDGGMGNISDLYQGSTIGIDHYVEANITKHLDVVIATHNDSDHTGGLKKILRNNAIQIKEIWLPALWMRRIDDLVNDPCAFTEEVIDEFDMNFNRTENVLERFDDDLSEDIEEDEVIWLSYMMILDQKYHRMLTRNYQSTVWDLLKKANAIKVLYQLAVSRKIKIRWFEYDIADMKKNFQSVATLGSPLKPVNCRLVKKALIKKISALKYLYLSFENRTSLVFFYEGISKSNSVLFSADSPLGFKLPDLSGALVTSPHHGLDSAGKAYSNIQGIPMPIIIRNSVGASESIFHQLKHTKYCDLCNNSVVAEQIEFGALSHGWQHKTGNTCSC